MRRERTADRSGMGDDAWRALYGVSDTASDVTRRVSASPPGEFVKGMFAGTDAPFWKMGFGPLLDRERDAREQPLTARELGELFSFLPQGWLTKLGVAGTAGVAGLGTAYSRARKQLFGGMNPQGMPQDKMAGPLTIGRTLKDDYQSLGEAGLRKFEHPPGGTDPPNVAALREQGLVPNISWDELLAPDPNFRGRAVTDPRQPKWEVDPTDGSWRLAVEGDQDIAKRNLLDAMAARTGAEYNTADDPELLRLLSIAEQSGIPFGARLQAGLARILPEQDYITLYRGMSTEEANGLQEYLRLAGEGTYEPGILLGGAESGGYGLRGDRSPLRSFSMSPRIALQFPQETASQLETIVAIDVPKKSIVMPGYHLEEELVVNVADKDFFRNARFVSSRPGGEPRRYAKKLARDEKRAARAEAEALARSDVGVDQPYGGPEFTQHDTSGPPYHWKPGMPVVSTPQKYHILLQNGIVKKGQKLAGAETVPEWRAAVEKLWKKHRKDLGLG